jgi:hypothetical protein
MLAQDTTKNGVEVVVVPFPEPWLSEKRYLFYGPAVCGTVLSRATLNALRTISDSTCFLKYLKPCANYLLQKQQSERLAPRLRTSKMTFFVNSCAVREGA